MRESQSRFPSHFLQSNKPSRIYSGKPISETEALIDSQNFVDRVMDVVDPKALILTYTRFISAPNFLLKLFAIYQSDNQANVLT